MALKNVYAKAAQTVGKGLTSARLLPATVPPRDARLRHWAFTLPRVHDVRAMNELDMPWWTYRAISYVDAWLSARPHPIRAFEYGSGASTAYLRRRVDEIHSVENHQGFADFIAPMLAEAGEVDLTVREGVPSQHPVIGSHKPGYENQDFADYVAVIDEVGGLFDLIVIDGRAREACLERAVPHLADDGIIVFDNTHRARYKEAIAKSGLHERRMFGLTPTLPYPDQTSILTKD
ncbi:class I SAM-dependent methyltransferase [Gryllotalpicola kribbensis]|jgi:hypothetical protein